MAKETYKKSKESVKMVLKDIVTGKETIIDLGKKDGKSDK